MASNTFGEIFKITTWGESHGKLMGVVIDGCPSNIFISKEEIEKELSLRRSRNSYTTKRKEKDFIEIASGIFKGKTTGAPISIIIKNEDVYSKEYEKNKDLLRPNHANFTYLKKYGIFDYRGGGRSSGRETVLRVIASTIAKKILKKYKIETLAYIKSVYNIEAKIPSLPLTDLKKKRDKSILLCPDPKATDEMISVLEKIKEEKESCGATIECQTSFLPPGLGDPIYQKLSSKLAHGIFSIPGVKGFEIGNGFFSTQMKGSEYHDHFFLNEENEIKTKTNHAGGLFGGITNGMPLVFRVAFKPTPSILKPINTLTVRGKKAVLEWKDSRFDVCFGLRCCPIVEAMTNLVLVDALLMQNSKNLQ